MANAKFIDATTWGNLTEIDVTDGENLFPQLPAGTYRPVLSGVDSVTVPALSAGTIDQATPSEGDTLTVSGSNATGSATYQWQKDGVDISGATSASLDTTGEGAGDYRRGVSDGVQGPVYTSAVTVGVAPSALFTDDFTSYTLGSNIHDSPRYSRAVGFLNMKVQDDGGTRIVGPVDQTQSGIITYVDQTVSANRKVSWTYHRARVGSGTSVEFFAAYTDGSNYVNALIDTAGWISIRHVVGGTGSFSTVSIPPGGLSEGETISIELDNGTMTVQVEGVNVTTPKTVPVVALGPPGFGMAAIASDTTDAAISYFEIEEI